jgi:hypothetical protein
VVRLEEQPFVPVDLLGNTHEMPGNLWNQDSEAAAPPACDAFDPDAGDPAGR